MNYTCLHCKETGVIEGDSRPVCQCGRLMVEVIDLRGVDYALSTTELAAAHGVVLRTVFSWIRRGLPRVSLYGTMNLIDVREARKFRPPKRGRPVK